MGEFKFKYWANKQSKRPEIVCLLLKYGKNAGLSKSAQLAIETKQDGSQTMPLPIKEFAWFNIEKDWIKFLAYMENLQGWEEEFDFWRERRKRNWIRADMERYGIIFNESFPKRKLWMKPVDEGEKLRYLFT